MNCGQQHDSAETSSQTYVDVKPPLKVVMIFHMLQSPMSLSDRVTLTSNGLFNGFHCLASVFSLSLPLTGMTIVLFHYPKIDKFHPNFPLQTLNKSSFELQESISRAPSPRTLPTSRKPSVVSVSSHRPIALALKRFHPKPSELDSLNACSYLMAKMDDLASYSRHYIFLSKNLLLKR